MDKRGLLIVSFVITALIVSLLIIIVFNFYPPNTSIEPTPTPTQSPTPTITPSPTQTSTPSPSTSPIPTSSNTPSYTYQVIHTYHHDPAAFTQGLLVESDDVLLESTGAYGAQSTLRRVALSNGTVLQEKTIPTIFAEGIALVDDRIIQLTWQDHLILEYNRTSFELLNQSSISTEGWGLTYDGVRLILSCGNSTMYFLDANTFQIIGQVNVHDSNGAVENLNELEYVNGDVYANVWKTNKIAIINPLTGQVKAYIDLAGLYQSPYVEGVLNGIAYNKNTGQLFITGKYWPNIYEISIIQN